MIADSVLFHVGVLLIFAGHRRWFADAHCAVFDALGMSARRQTAAGDESRAGVAGVMAIIGASLLIHRRFFRSAGARRFQCFSDNMIILACCGFSLALGLATIPYVDAQHLDGHEMVKFMDMGARHLHFP
jgi:nitrate reductase gamma subunit